MEIKYKVSVVIVNFNAGTGFVDTVRATIVDDASNELPHGRCRKALRGLL